MVTKNSASESPPYGGSSKVASLGAPWSGKGPPPSGSSGGGDGSDGGGGNSMYEKRISDLEESINTKVLPKLEAMPSKKDALVLALTVVFAIVSVGGFTINYIQNDSIATNDRLASVDGKITTVLENLNSTNLQLGILIGKTGNDKP